jgi:DinB family protein
MKIRTNALAERLEQGAAALASFASSLTDAQWQSRLPGDGRKIGVVVNHVAAVYPIEISLAQTLVEGKPVTGVTGEVINEMNAAHARDNEGATKAETLELLRTNSAAAAAAIRALDDEDLDRANVVSLYANAPLTCQFVLEDHAVRHSYHHLAKIRAAIKSQSVTSLTGTTLGSRELAVR